MLKLELTGDPAIPLLGINPKEIKSRSPKDTCTIMFIAAVFISSQDMKQPKCSSMD